jgi:hypothetical protein
MAASRQAPVSRAEPSALRYRSFRVPPWEPPRRVAPGVSPGGSHRSGRAEFPHPARQVAGSLGATLRTGLGIGSG